MPELIICDVDGTLLSGSDAIVKNVDYVNGLDVPVVIVTGRMEDERADTAAALDAAGVNYTDLVMNDTDMATVEYKTGVAEQLLTDYDVKLAVDNDEACRAAYSKLGIDVLDPKTIEAPRAMIAEPSLELNERQSDLVEAYLEASNEYGVFDAGSGADGAHYIAAADNVFAADGLACEHCVFYQPEGRCQIVQGPDAGQVEPGGVCKLWIIPTAAGAAEPKDEMNTFRHTAPVKLEVRESAMGTEYLTVTGYAAVFDQMSHDLGGFREIIQPGAFADVLGASPDVHLVIGHNMDLPLARTRNGTLELGEDIRGLKMWARIDSRLSYAKDLAVQLKSGLVDQMSFAFTIPEGGDTWTVDDSGAVTRTVNRIDGLYDVSVVAAGAYPQTDVQAVRALLRDAADKGLIPSNLLDTSQPETVGGDSVEQHAGGTVEPDVGGRQAIQNLQAAKAKTKAALHNHSKGL